MSVGAALLEASPPVETEAVYLPKLDRTVHVRALPADFVIAMQERADDAGHVSPFLSEILYHGVTDEQGARAFESLEQVREFVDRAPVTDVGAMLQTIAARSRLSVSTETIEGN